MVIYDHPDNACAGHVVVLFFDQRNKGYSGKYFTLKKYFFKKNVGMIFFILLWLLNFLVCRGFVFVVRLLRIAVGT